MINVLRFLFGLALFFSAVINAEALEAFTPSETMDGAFIGKYVEHFVDPTKHLTLADVRSEAHRPQFAPVNRDTLDFGLSDAAHWIHLTVNNPGNNHTDWIMQAEHPLLNHIEVYEIGPDGQVKFHEGGSQIPFNRRDIAYRKNVFSMTAPPGTSEIYIKVWAVSRVIANCSLTAWGTNQFIAKNNLDTLLLGLYYGALLVMCLYNLFIYFSVRNTAYLLYVTYIIFAGLSYLVINGLVFQYLWLASPNAGIQFAMFTFLFATLFSRSFLNTRKHIPRIDKLLLAFSIFFLLNALLLFVGAESAPRLMTVGYFSSLLFPPLLIYTGVRCLMAGVRQARFYVAAWTVYLTGVLLYFLKDFGVLPYSFVTVYSIQIGTLADVVLLSFALADRIKILREEKEAAETRTIDILVKSKEELEAQVALKTQEHRKAREEAENATRLKDKFVSLVSHDLRSPLASVIGLLRMMASPDRRMEPAREQDVIQRAVRNTEGMVEMIDTLLDISRLSSGSIVPKLSFIDARIIAGAAIDNIAPLADAKGVAITNAVSPGLRLYADRILLGEVLGNLLSNAVKFCRKGDRIDVFVPEDRPEVIAVRDTGAGIAPEILKDIFRQEIKTTTPGTAGEKGTGLGLPLCKEIMRAHGGEISVESAVGKGSTFFVILPKAVPVKLLVVDDQEVVRAVIRKYCAGIFPGILEAGNGAEALEILRNVAPHIIITDINMPVMDGLEFIQKVRSGNFARNAPIIAMTSDESWPTPNGMDIRSYCLHIGADDFVNKPVAANDLVPRLSRLLQGAR